MTCECQESIGSGWDQDVPVVAFIVYVVIMLWVFLGIAVVCDDHFEAALMTICDQLNLSKAVGGATFMAAGSSAPELATSLVAVFTTRDATGLGTILGSAVFNLVAIICLSGIFGAGPYHKLPAAIVGQCFRLENELIPQSGTWHMGQTMQNNGAAVSYPSS